MPRGRPKKQPIAQKITSALNVAQEEVDKFLPAIQQESFVPAVPIPEVIIEPAPRISKDAKDDYEFARTNLYGLLDKGNDLFNGIKELAIDSDHPRTYEVAGNILKVLIEGNRELMGLQKDIREVEKKFIPAPEDETRTLSINHAENVNNMMIEGTTMEMIEMLRELRQKKLEAKEQNNG